MTRIPLSWNAGSDSASNENTANGAVSGQRDTLESNSLAWAKTHPIMTLLALYPCWAVYTSVAPAFAMMARNRSEALRKSTSGYKLVGKMARVALRELANRRHSRPKN
jgi:hypothetical protein